MNAVVLDIEETVVNRDQPLKQPGRFEYFDASRNILLLDDASIEREEPVVGGKKYCSFGEKRGYICVAKKGTLLYPDWWGVCGSDGCASKIHVDCFVNFLGLSFIFSMFKNHQHLYLTDV